MPNEPAVPAAAHPGDPDGDSPASGAALPAAALPYVLEGGPDGLLVLDADLRCRWANAHARAALGGSAAAIAGAAVCDLVPALAGTPVERALRAVAAEGRAHVIRRLVTPSGRWYEVHALPMNAGGVVAHFRDVTDTVDAERALREGERRYRRLVEHASDFVLVLSADGIVRYASPAVGRVVGRTPGELEGRAWLDLVHDEDRAETARAFREALAAPPGETVTVRGRVRRPDGEWVTLETIGGRIAPESPAPPTDDGAPDGALTPALRDDGTAEWPGVVDLRPPELRRRRAGEDAEPTVVITVRDVTEQAAAEAALRASEASYRVLTEQLGDGIAVIDAAGNGRLVIVNARLAEMTGYSREELLAMRVPDLVVDAERDTRDRVDRLQRGETLLTRRQLRRKDGTPLTTEMSTRMVGTRIQAVIRDVSERELFEEHRRAVQKLEALGLLAGSVAHDFNNFLLAIQSNVELALDEVAGAAAAPGIRAELEDIRQVAQRAARLTRQLLTFSRKQAPQPATFPLAEAVTGIEQMLRRLVEPGVRLVVEAEPGGGWVRADLGQLEQVVMNLVMNARDSMREAMGDAGRDGGAVTVRVHPEAHRAPRRVGIAEQPIPAGDYVVLSVTDTGTGMTRETAVRVFEPLFTTKPAGTGTGLGLWTVHAIVAQAGGYVTVESAPGRGSTFAVWLPAAPGGADPADGAALVAGLAHG